MCTETAKQRKYIDYRTEEESGPYNRLVLVFSGVFYDILGKKIVYLKRGNERSDDIEGRTLRRNRILSLRRRYQSPNQKNNVK